MKLYFRQEGGTWLLTPVAGLEASARLKSLDITLSLAEIYSGVEFPAETKPSDDQTSSK